MYVAKNVRRTINTMFLVVKNARSESRVMAFEEDQFRDWTTLRLAAASNFCCTDEAIARSLDAQHQSQRPLTSRRDVVHHQHHVVDLNVVLCRRPLASRLQRWEILCNKALKERISDALDRLPASANRVIVDVKLRFAAIAPQ